ncbi:MAG: DNA polymerase III subunit gamma/tau [Solirubrobacterales bacterium]
MAEQSLYRRHRPQSFADVVGQEHVVRTLSNAIERDRVHHAYLFVGSRGTGKTSMAKILAKSLNCVNGPTLTPCGECESCVAIAAGGSMDVIEMDAASNRSVDDIRELRERVGYAPAAGRWKVYILDEAHMLTREAWNAFLKTLEEPPPNTVFVLATTEAHKVMPTIVDRCQRFDFSRPSPEEIAVVLRRVAAAESITIDDGAVGAIARAASGSFRDGLGTLDQLVAYSGNEIATDDVLAVLGVADAELLFAAAEAIAAGDGRAALQVSSDLARSGRDPARFAAELVSHLRQLLVISTVGEIPDHFLVVAEHQVRLTDQAQRLGEVALVRAIDQLSEAIAAIREGDEARMTVELALLRSARPEIDPSASALAQRLERLERGGVQGAHSATAPPPTQPSVAAPAPAVRAPQAPASPVQPAAEAPAQQPAAEAPAQQPAAEAPAPAAAPPPQPAAEAPAPAAPAPAAAPPAGEAPAAPPSPTPSAECRAPVAAHSPQAPAAEAPAQTAAAPPAAPAEAAPATPAPAPAAGPPDLDGITGLWPSIIDQMKQSGAGLLAAAFDGARPVAVRGDGAVQIAFPASAAFNRRKAEAKENRTVLIEAMQTVTGAPLHPEFVTLEEVAEAAAEAPAGESDGSDREDELYRRIVAEFDAEVVVDEEPEQTGPPEGMPAEERKEGTS